ncbi:hypothetical protein [Paenibacillus humicus]|uniref:hypothetical protein n=1 Tax=Paenibacillus humicus TaxID=412861 RepID=UPI003F187F2C
MTMNGFFRQTKTRHLRMTGLGSWNRYIWRNEEFVVWVDDALKQEDLLKWLSHMDYERYLQERKGGYLDFSKEQSAFGSAETQTFI